jgi:phage terminase small subunit
MAPKHLKIIENEPPGTIQPPRPLGEHGLALWRSINSEYDISDAGGREMLAQACAALDRAEALREHIDAEGEVIRSKSGLKAHPALKDEIAARSFVVRTLHRLGLDVEAIKPPGRPPGYGG